MSVVANCVSLACVSVWSVESKRSWASVASRMLSSEAIRCRLSTRPCAIEP